jgi:predicted nuclease of predicted toxin-antitoxin system
LAPHDLQGLQMSAANSFLIDNALSPMLADSLRRAGFDAVHVQERSLATADDETIFDLAAKESRVLVSMDTDFGTILANRQASKPSVIPFHRRAGRRPATQFELLTKNLPQIGDALIDGSVVVFEQSRIRIRRLPIGSDHS